MPTRSFTLSITTTKPLAATNDALTQAVLQIADTLAPPPTTAQPTTDPATVDLVERVPPTIPPTAPWEFHVTAGSEPPQNPPGPAA